MTSIEWTHRPGTTGETWNPIRARHRATGRVGWHCTHASDCCRNCYAERQNLNRRGLAFGTGLPYKPGHEQDLDIVLDEKTLTQPLRWRHPRTIFVCSMTDLFGAFVPDAMIDRVLAIAALCPQHTFIVLTKRSARMRDFMSGFTCDGARRFHIAVAAGRLMEDGDSAHDSVANAAWPLANVWLGVSAERQQEADERIPDLLATPAAIRFASIEPLLGAVDLTDLDHTGDCRREQKHGIDCLWKTTLRPRLNWVIVGGESGPNARPMHPDWARALRDQCDAANVPFFFKQWGEWAPARVRPSETLGKYAIASAGPHSDFWPQTVSLVDQYPRQINLFGGAKVLENVGKHRAGRTLDGVTHDGWPTSPLAGEDRASPRTARIDALGEGCAS
jgi:protein gp37